MSPGPPDESSTVTWALLGSLSPDDRDRVMRSARRRRFARGEVIFHEGDPGDALHLVESGVVAVQVSLPGGERATLNTVGAGEFFGELALLQGSDAPRRTATVIALAPVETLTVSGTAFTELRTANPALEGLVVAALAHRVEQLSARLLEALYVGVDRRVYRRLIELADSYGASTTPIVIPLSQEDLAMMAGASRPTVNQVLQKLVGRNMISLGRREITILDLVALRAAAPGDGD